ncbi:FecR family protein [Acetobacter cibinongensis]|uniref:Histidine kinase n=1 Tax=Acetobacter cibinongensis TaxID=146475 RepID=A0A1Z5YRP9_9PROT|nr:FecR domain-containing protein [Acetobacter cibinongensis]OUI99559.1 hypothetical protein HK14_14300 [Acetobacter cibinongensis]
MTVPAKNSETLPPKEAASLWYIRLREAPADEDLKARFKTWLREDPKNEQAWASIIRVTKVMKHMSQPHMLSSLNQTVFHDKKRSEKQRKTFRWAVGGAIGLGAAASLVLITLWPDISVRWRADAYTTFAETRTLALADGSSITLAPLSAVKYDVTGRQRGVTLLQGEALFTVQHDAQRPFKVTTGDVVATDIGTIFDVALTSHGTKVAVLEGQSRVQTLDLFHQSVILSAGEWAHIQAGSLNQGREAPENIATWQQGTVLMENGTVSDLVAALKPWQPGLMIVLDQDLGRQPVSGVYNLHHPIQALELALKHHGGHVHRLARWLTVISRS